MKTVFIDASSAILLYKTDLFTACCRTYCIVMAEAVFKEVTVEGYPGAGFFRAMGSDIRVLNPEKGAGIHSNMDKGEQETLDLFEEQAIAASFIMMDDGKGARYCYARSIPFINALLIPKIFWYSGRMDKAIYMDKTKSLTRLGRYSANIIKKAGALSRNDLAAFIPDET